MSSLSNEEVKELCLELLRADTVNSITNILKKYDYLDKEVNWEPRGGTPANWSTVGDQSESVPALVEKLVNCEDHVLTKINWGSVTHRNFSASDIREESKTQKRKCNLCRRYVSRYTCQIDHKDGNRNNNNSRNCQILCSNCHSVKHRERSNKKLWCFRGDRMLQDRFLKLGELNMRVRGGAKLYDT